MMCGTVAGVPGGCPGADGRRASRCSCRAQVHGDKRYGAAWRKEIALRALYELAEQYVKEKELWEQGGAGGRGEESGFGSHPLPGVPGLASACNSPRPSSQPPSPALPAQRPPSSGLQVEARPYIAAGGAAVMAPPVAGACANGHANGVAAPVQDRGPLYKTKICYHFNGAGCALGADCNFAHGMHELRGGSQRGKGRSRYAGNGNISGGMAQHGVGNRGYHGGGGDPRVAVLNGHGRGGGNMIMNGGLSIDSGPRSRSVSSTSGLSASYRGNIPNWANDNGYNGFENGAPLLSHMTLNKLNIPNGATPEQQEPDRELLLTPTTEEIDARLASLGFNGRAPAEGGMKAAPPQAAEEQQGGSPAPKLTMYVPKQMMKTLGMVQFKPGEKKVYSRQALLIFQHMYVGPPLDADLKKITEMLAEVTYDWTPQNDKWLKDRRTRRRSLGGATGGRRLHDEVRWRKVEPIPQPSPTGDAVTVEEKKDDVQKDVTDRRRRHSLPAYALSTEVSSDWEDAIQKIFTKKLPMTPGKGMTGTVRKNVFNGQYDITPKQLFKNHLRLKGKEGLNSFRLSL